VSNYYFVFWLEFWLSTGYIIMEMEYLTTVLDEILAGVSCDGPTGMIDGIDLCRRW